VQQFIDGQQLRVANLSRIQEKLGIVPGSGLPVGGTAGQVLTKLSATNFDADWQTIAVATGTFDVDDGNAAAGAAFLFEDGTA
jgi:hypothetical protein